MPNLRRTSKRCACSARAGYVLYAAAASWGSLVLFAFVGLTIFVLARLFDASTHTMSGYALVFLYLIMPIEGLLARCRPSARRGLRSSASNS